jgi:chaperonin cofactor prefoldin
VRAGLTTLQITNDQQLTELLNSLEKKVATLNSKSFTVLDTLEHATQAIRAVLSDITNDETGTDENVRRVW